MNALNKWIEGPFEEDEEEEKNKSKKRKEKDRQMIFSQAAQSLALLDCLLVKESIRITVLSYSEQVMQLMRNLLQYFVLLQHRMVHAPSEGGIKGETLLSALITYCKFFIHISCSFEEVEKDSEALTEILNWAEDVVLPLYKDAQLEDIAEPSKGRKRKKAVESEAHGKQFTVQVVEILSKMFSEMIGLNLCSSPVVTRIVTFLTCLTLDAGKLS